MKNDLMRYVLKKTTIVQSFIAVCIAAVVSLGVIIFSAVFLDPPAKEKALNNITTVPLAFWMFISAVTVSSECANMSICLNRSRRSALKTVFASLLISTVVFAAVNFAAEALLSGVCPGLGLNYSFSPLIKIFGIVKTGTDIAGLALAFAFQLLVYYCIGIAGALFMTVCLKCGKWAWVIFWLAYMTLLMFGRTIVSGLRSAASSMFSSTGAFVLCLLAVTSVVCTIVQIILARKLELNKNALMFGYKRTTQQ
ncbi:MAG: hypothetical protein II168_06390 [Ruminococcus sp.]|nr:hypothetical protein [Ruminococcus sp.]